MQPERSSRLSGIGQIHIGTSGWLYAQWRGELYPGWVSADEALETYARRFRSVEINTTFYDLPPAATLDRWYAQTPQDFVFSVAADRRITHECNLEDCEDVLPAFFRGVDRLKDKLGPILFQLPARWPCDHDRLAAFLARLPHGYRFAFEFRCSNWLSEKVLALLARHDAAFCVFDLLGHTAPAAVTSDFAYVRLHGPAENGAHMGSYSGPALESWARQLAGWSLQGTEVYCYFCNDECAHAVHNAWTLAALVAPNYAPAPSLFAAPAVA